MFSGIVESVQPILEARALEGAVRISVRRPEGYDDLKPGDSVATDGICLTVESHTPDAIHFALAAETLRVLGWPGPETLVGRRVNLERSLRYGDRIHGHLVSGHVEGRGELVSRRMQGESLFLSVRIPETLLPYVWPKGSVTLNGVSLTVNGIDGAVVEVCLIPETVKRTNLGDLKPGDPLNVEPDWMAKALNRALQFQMEKR